MNKYKIETYVSTHLMPIGVTPHWVVQNERILKLSEAVSRYAAFIDTEAKISNLKECYEYIKEYEQ